MLELICGLKYKKMFSIIKNSILLQILSKAETALSSSEYKHSSLLLRI